MRHTTERENSYSNEIQNPCFISKHCQTKYNVNRDKVTCLRRKKHNLEIENKAEKAFAVITFQTQLERFEIWPTKEKAITEHSA